MDRDLLRTFLDLLETRNFNRTADSLGVTQSTVSNRIRVLEDAVGARLFERGRSGAAPTAAGTVFEGHARKLLAAWAHAVRDATLRSGRGEMLRLSAQLSLQSSVLVSWAIGLRTAMPDLTLDLQADYSAQIMRDVVDGHVDIGVLFAPRMQPDVRIRNAGHETFRMMSTHATSLAEVAAATYVHVGYTDAFDRAHDAELPDRFRGNLSVGNEGIALELLKRIGGTAYLPASVRYDPSAVSLRPVADAPDLSLPVYSAVHRSRRSDHVVQRALRALETALKAPVEPASGDR